MRLKFLPSVAILLVAVLGLLFLSPQKAYPDELEDINKQIAELTDALNKSVQATKPLESQLESMQKQVAGIKNQVAAIDADLVKKKKDIDNGYKALAAKQQILADSIRAYYIQSYHDSPLVTLLESTSASEMTLSLAYQRAKTNQDKAIIMNIALSIADLEEKERLLKSEQERLVVLRRNLDEQSAKLDEVIAGAKNYQSQVSGQIAELSSRQQQIINERSGGFTVSGNSELADDYLASVQGFNESAPSGYFAVFSFGAYSHRNGMSQYGARGRAQQGQSAEDILKAYYPNATLKKDFSVMGNINVDGHGSMPFEEQYLQGIYEMPSSWHKEALKAQAVAARTFAIKHTNNGQGSICTNEGCQVFKNEKKGGAWEEAVNETRGWVLVDGGGNPVSTQYASTHGGWTRTSGWDTTDGSGGSSLLSKAYDAIGGSPWLYKAWWREGYSNSGSTCGRANPWLSPEEMADIVNAAVALKAGGIDTSRIIPVTTSCWGGNPYSMDELKNLVSGKGGITNATSVSVSLGDGRTNSVTINGVNLSGDEFCKAFNLRAPGYVRIPQWSGSACGGAFFNIQRK